MFNLIFMFKIPSSKGFNPQPPTLTPLKFSRLFKVPRKF